MTGKITTEPQYGRYVLRDDGKWETRYTAIDCADEMLRCTCGQPECFAGRILSFRDHVSELYRAILACRHQEALPGDDWSAVLYPLQMAASIEDVHADTAYVDDTMSLMMCRPAYEYEEAHSEVASKYVAASSVFSFVWAAYEATVRLTAPDEFKRLAKENATGQRGRSLVESRTHLFPDFEGIATFARVADRCCEKGGLFDVRLQKIRGRCAKMDFVFAAELVREFRNHLYHGEDEPPQPESWDTRGETRPRVWRFYAAARLALLLIQFLTRVSVEDSSEIEFGYDHDTEEEIYMKPSVAFATLHLRTVRRDGLIGVDD